MREPLIAFLHEKLLYSADRAWLTVSIFGAGSVFGGVGILILRYLNYGLEPYQPEVPSRSVRDLLRIKEETRVLLAQARNLAETSKKEHALTEQERKDITANLEHVLSNSLREDALKAFEDNYAESTLSERNNRIIREKFLRCQERLNSETGRLGRRGNINLTLGFLATMLALAVLAQITFFAPLPQNISNYGELMVRYLPRLALAIFIQVFAFFFLRLYKTTLEEIKFFQNEMTNIELASIALETSNKAKDAPYIQEICRRLLEIDRNPTPTIFPKPGQAKQSEGGAADLIGIAKEVLSKIKT